MKDTESNPDLTRAQFVVSKRKSGETPVQESASTPPKNTIEPQERNNTLEIDDIVKNIDNLLMALGYELKKQDVTPEMIDTIIWRLKNMKPKGVDAKQYFFDVANEVLKYKEILDDEEKEEMLAMKNVLDKMPSRTEHSLEEDPEFGFGGDKDTTDKSEMKKTVINTPFKKAA